MITNPDTVLPLVLLDVDGVINDLPAALGTQRPWPHHRLQLGEATVCIPLFVPPLLQYLDLISEIQWCTTWGELANGVLTPVLEIGPGLGAITAMLVEVAGQVVVFEIDHGVMRVLRERFGQAITIVAGDAVKTLGLKGPAGEAGGSISSGPDLVVGNLPYRSAAAIVAVLLESDRIASSCRRMVFTVQREMARRMVASPGGKEYSTLSVLCGMAGTVTHHSDVAAGSFYPVPEVVSSLVSVEPKQVDHGLLRLASLCARSLFASRRKTIRNNLPISRIFF